MLIEYQYSLNLPISNIILYDTHYKDLKTNIKHPIPKCKFNLQKNDSTTNSLFSIKPTSIKKNKLEKHLNQPTFNINDKYKKFIVNYSGRFSVYFKNYEITNKVSHFDNKNLLIYKLKTIKKSENFIFKNILECYSINLDYIYNELINNVNNIIYNNLLKNNYASNFYKNNIKWMFYGNGYIKYTPLYRAENIVKLEELELKNVENSSESKIELKNDKKSSNINLLPNNINKYRNIVFLLDNADFNKSFLNLNFKIFKKLNCIGRIIYENLMDNSYFSVIDKNKNLNLLCYAKDQKIFTFDEDLVYENNSNNELNTYKNCLIENVIEIKKINNAYEIKSLENLPNENILNELTNIKSYNNFYEVNTFELTDIFLVLTTKFLFILVEDKIFKYENEKNALGFKNKFNVAYNNITDVHNIDESNFLHDVENNKLKFTDSCDDVNLLILENNVIKNHIMPNIFNDIMHYYLSNDLDKQIIMQLCSIKNFLPSFYNYCNFKNLLKSYANFFIDNLNFNNLNYTKNLINILKTTDDSGKKFLFDNFQFCMTEENFEDFIFVIFHFPFEYKVNLNIINDNKNIIESKENVYYRFVKLCIDNTREDLLNEFLIRFVDFIEVKENKKLDVYKNIVEILKNRNCFYFLRLLGVENKLKDDNIKREIKEVIKIEEKYLEYCEEFSNFSDKFFY